MISSARHGMLMLLAGAAFACAPIAGAAFAQETGLGQNFNGLQVSGDQPISIEANQLDVDDKQSMATFTGNVTVSQGPTELRAGKLLVFYKKQEGGEGAQQASSRPATGALPGGSNQIDRLEAMEKVYVKSADQVATADKATFDMNTQLVTMTGEVVLSQGQNVAQGCRLTIQMETGRARLESANCPGRATQGDGRVRLMLTPDRQQNTN